MKELRLRYGINPHQSPARAFVREGALPFEILNGRPSYVNLLDALNAWQLVRELSRAAGLPAAASFKHVSPAGAAVGTPLDDGVRLAYRVDDLTLTPLAAAYARARGADRLASFGDIAALSHSVDEPTAALLAREVSDGVIAPGYEPEALARLRRKRQGAYLVLRVSPEYAPPVTEARDVFGVTLEQRRNDALIDPHALGEAVTRAREIGDAARRDLVVAVVTTKYTQSNSICLAKDGQAIGVGAGQQSRIGCVRLAAEKAELWWLRQHPRALALRFEKTASRPERDNAVDEFTRSGLTADERREWLATLREVALASDGYFPFRDSLDRAARTGVRYVAQPCGSARDAEVIAAADNHAMTMLCTGVRLFQH